jgi:hypothetical protein
MVKVPVSEGEAGGAAIGEFIMDSMQLAGVGEAVLGRVAGTWGRLELKAPEVGGTLSPFERNALQGVANEFDTTIDVVGSRAAGRGRGVGTDLPVGKGPGTRSDIDVRIDSQLDIDTGGALSDRLKDLKPGLVDVRTQLPGGSTPPVIKVTPQKK